MLEMLLIAPNSVKTMSKIYIINLFFFGLPNTVWLIQWTILFFQILFLRKVVWGKIRLTMCPVWFTFYVIKPASVLNDFGIWKNGLWLVCRKINTEILWVKYPFTSESSRRSLRFIVSKNSNQYAVMNHSGILKHGSKSAFRMLSMC